MQNSESLQERAEAIRKIATERLGLTLSDSLIETLSAGKSISLEDLLQEHSLADVGATLIRVDMLSRANFGCPRGRECDPGYIGCKPICVRIPARPPLERSQLEFRIYPDWSE